MFVCLYGKFDLGLKNRWRDLCISSSVFCCCFSFVVVCTPFNIMESPQNYLNYCVTFEKGADAPDVVHTPGHELAHRDVHEIQG